jgi:hypothetical protein
VVLVLWVSGAAAVETGGTPYAAATRPGVDAGPTKVLMRLVLIDVARISGAQHALTADVAVLAQWRDPRLAADVDGLRKMPLESVWNPRFQIVNGRDPSIQLPELVEVAPDGTVVYLQRIFDDFTTRMNLRSFPFDRQTFEIQIVAVGYGRDELVFETDPDGPAGAEAAEFTITDWKIGPLAASAESLQVVPGGRELSAYVGRFEGQRFLAYWIWKAFVTVAIIVFMSWLAFWIGPTMVAPRVSITVTSMLTLVAYRFVLAGDLPVLPYLTALDYFLLGCTALVFSTLFMVVATGHLASSDREERADRLVSLCRWAFPAAFLLISVVAFLVI